MGAAMRGAAAFWGRGQRPRPQNMPAAGLARQRAGGRSPPAAAPLRWVFHQRQKGNEKARPFAQPDHAPSTTRKKVVATASRCEGACNRAGEPSGAFSGEEPRRNERSPGKGTLPGPSGWSPRRRGQRRHKPPRRGLLSPGNLSRQCANIAVRVGPIRSGGLRWGPGSRLCWRGSSRKRRRWPWRSQRPAGWSPRWGRWGRPAGSCPDSPGPPPPGCR